MQFLNILKIVKEFENRFPWNALADKIFRGWVLNVFFAKIIGRVSWFWEKFPRGCHIFVFYWIFINNVFQIFILVLFDTPSPTLPSPPMRIYRTDWIYLRFWVLCIISHSSLIRQKNAFNKSEYKQTRKYIMWKLHNYFKLKKNNVVKKFVFI